MNLSNKKSATLLTSIYLSKKGGVHAISTRGGGFHSHQKGRGMSDQFHVRYVPLPKKQKNAKSNYWHFPKKWPRFLLKSVWVFFCELFFLFLTSNLQDECLTVKASFFKLKTKIFIYMGRGNVRPMPCEVRTSAKKQKNAKSKYWHFRKKWPRFLLKSVWVFFCAVFFPFLTSKLQDESLTVKSSVFDLNTLPFQIFINSGICQNSMISCDCVRQRGIRGVIVIIDQPKIVICCDKWLHVYRGGKFEIETTVIYWSNMICTFFIKLNKSINKKENIVKWKNQ